MNQGDAADSDGEDSLRQDLREDEQEDIEEEEDVDEEDDSEEEDDDPGWRLEKALSYMRNGMESIALNLTTYSGLSLQDAAGRYVLWEGVARCLVSIKRLRIRFVESPDWEALKRVLMRIKNPIELDVGGSGYDGTRESVEGFARAIESQPCITVFKTFATFAIGSLDTVFSALSTLPNLREGELSPALSGEDEGEELPPSHLTRFFRVRSLKTVTLSNFRFPESFSRAMADGLRDGSTITELRLRSCTFRGNATGLAEAIAEENTLEDLKLNLCNFDRAAEFYQALGASMSVNTSLVNLYLRVPPHAVSVLSPVFRAFANNKSVKYLSVYLYELLDAELSQAISTGLRHNTTLEKILFHYLSAPNEANLPLLHEAFSFLETNRHLESFYVQFEGSELHFPSFFIDMMGQLRGHRNLTELMFGINDGVSIETFAAGISALQQNTTLKYLTTCFHGDFDEDGDKEMILTAVRNNYGLEDLGLLPSKVPTVGTILRLNKAGRRYLMEESPSASAGIGVLSAVTDDLDCLYFHLRENPALCEESQKASRKRKQVAH